VALVAVVVRLVYLAEHARTALFAYPILDARWYDLVAQALATGAPTERLVTGFRPVLYPTLLSLLYRLDLASGPLLAQLSQHALGVGIALAVAVLARRLTRREDAALASGCLYAVAPVPLFFEGELLAETLFLALLAAFLVTASDDRAGAGPATHAGAWLGVACAVRPNALLFAPLPLIGRDRRARRAAGAALGLLAALVASAALLSPIHGGLRLLPSAGGVNLYLGNRRGADGLVPRQDFAVTYGDEYRDSVEVFSAEAARADGVADSNAARERYWLRRAGAEIAADPWGRLRLLGRKAIVVLWNGEVPNNRSFDFAAREETPILRWLPSRFGLLFVLAVAGWSAAPASRGRNLLSGFALLHALGVVVFFVADRYRLPLYLPVAALAGPGAIRLIEAARAPGRRPSLALGGLLLASVLVTFVDWTGARSELPGAERDLFFRSLARLQEGDADGAADDARRAVRLTPNDAASWLQVGRAELGRHDLDAAETALATAARLAPNEPRIPHAAGIARELRGDLAGALALQLEALRLGPGLQPARWRAAWLEIVLGDPARAAELLAGGGERPVDDVRWLLTRAELDRAAGRSGASERWSSAARDLDPVLFEELERQRDAARNAAPDSTQRPPRQ